MTQLREMLGKEKKGGWSEVLVLLFCLFFIILLLDLRFTMKFVVVEVSGRSMEDTVFDGDILYAERGEAPEHGDIVIIDVTPYREVNRFSGDYIIKRIIGLAGDVVRIEHGAVFVKYAGEEEFTKLSEDYTKGATGTSFGEATFTVGEGEIFFLGDHRSDSTDSRMVGCFKADDIVGVVPDWAVKYKSAITAWETFRSHLGAKDSKE